MAAELEVKIIDDVKISSILDSTAQYLNDVFDNESEVTLSVTDVNDEGMSPKNTRDLNRSFIQDDNIVITSSRGGEVSLSVSDLTNMEELEEDEAGLWVTLSMNLDRTNLTFMLTLALATKIAELSGSNVLDESGILGNDRFVDPSYVHNNFKKIISKDIFN